MKKVFCTTLYVQEDASLEKSVRSALREKGIESVYIPENANIVGDVLPESVRRTIDKSLFVLIILSPAFEKSEPMRAVIKYAFSNRKMLLPYKIHPQKLGFGLQIMLGQSHWLDVSHKERPEDGISDLCDAALIHCKNFLEKEKLGTRKRARHYTFLSGTALAATAALALYAFPPHGFFGSEEKTSGIAEAPNTTGRPETRPGLSIPLAGGNVMEFILIPSGRANGSFVPRDFYLGKTEVTQAQYFEITKENPSKNHSENAPVEQLYWADAMAFCSLLTQRCHQNGTLPKTQMFSLPTSTQWQRAENEESPKSVTEAELIAWFRKNSGGKTHPVAQKAPNSFGLYDMHGNVWEWCRDSAPVAADNRYFCGRDFNQPWTDLIFPKNRENIRPDYKKDDLGFRVAVVPNDGSWERFLPDNPENPYRSSPPRIKKRHFLEKFSKEERERQSALLAEAIKSRNFDAAKAALLAGASPDTQFKDGTKSFVLEAAAWNGLPEFVELLLSCGANPNVYSPGKLDPMSTLFIDRNSPSRTNGTKIKIAELLCDYGFDVNSDNDWGNSVLRDTVLWGDKEVARVLLHYGANPQHKGYNRQTAISAARGRADASQWIELLTRTKQRSEPTYGNGKTILAPDTD